MYEKRIHTLLCTERQELGYTGKRHTCKDPIINTSHVMNEGHALIPNLKMWSTAGVMSALVLSGCAHSSSDNSQQHDHRAVAVSLQSHHWQLQRALDAQQQVMQQWQLPARDNHPARTIRLKFSPDQTLSVDRLCNHMQGRYQTKAQAIHVSRMVTTMMACSDAELMRLEQRVAQKLPTAKSWDIKLDTPAMLELKFEDGSVWQLQGTPTHETLYGKSEQVFLEVAAEKAACQHPLMPDARCLKVREVHYNSQGIKTSEGDWSIFNGSIEGYQHQEGVRNVLRLKRYERTHVPADASRYIYVHDMTVESEQVR